MINKKILSIIIILFTVVIFAPNLTYAQGQPVSPDSPSVASARSPIVDCKTVDTCDWQNFLEVLNKVKNFGFQLVVIMSVIFIVYAGGLYIFSGENAGKRTQANAIMSNVVIGFFLAAAGWLIVSAVLHTLGVKDTKLAPADLINNNDPIN